MILRADRLDIAVPGRPPLIRGLDLEIGPGAITVLRSLSGAKRLAWGTSGAERASSRPLSASSTSMFS